MIRKWRMRLNSDESFHICYLSILAIKKYFRYSIKYLILITETGFFCNTTQESHHLNPVGSRLGHISVIVECFFKDIHTFQYFILFYCSNFKRFSCAVVEDLSRRGIKLTVRNALVGTRRICKLSH